MPVTFSAKTVNAGGSVGTAGMQGLVASKTGKFLAVASRNTTVFRAFLLNSTSGQYDEFTKGTGINGMNVSNVAISSDENWLYLANQASIRRCSLQANPLVQDSSFYIGLSARPTFGTNLFEISPDGRLLAYNYGTANPYGARFADLSTQSASVSDIATGADSPSQGAWSEDGVYFAFRAAQRIFIAKRTGNTMALVDQGASDKSIIATNMQTNRFAFGKDSAFLVAGGELGVIKVFKRTGDVFTEITGPFATYPTMGALTGVSTLGSDDEFLALMDWGSSQQMRFFAVGAIGTGMLSEVAANQVVGKPTAIQNPAFGKSSPDGNTYITYSDPSYVSTNNMRAWSFTSPPTIRGTLVAPKLKAAGRFEQKKRASGALSLPKLKALGSVKVPLAVRGAMLAPKLIVRGDLYPVRPEAPSQALLQMRPTFLTVSSGKASLADQNPPYTITYGFLSAPKLKSSGVAGIKPKPVGQLTLPKLKIAIRATNFPGLRGSLRLPHFAASGAVEVEGRDLTSALRLSPFVSSGNIRVFYGVSGTASLPKVEVQSFIAVPYYLDTGVRLPKLRARGIVLTSASFYGDFAFKKLQALGFGGQPGGAAGALSLPALRSEGRVIVPYLEAEADIHLPSLTLAGGAGWPYELSASFNLPKFIFSGQYGDVVKASADFGLAPMRLSALAGPDTIMGGDLSLKALAMAAVAGQDVQVSGQVSLPAAHLAMRMDPVVLLAGAGRLPAMKNFGYATVGIREVYTGPMRLPRISVSGYVEQPPQVSARLTLPKLRMLAGGYQQFGVNADIALPKLKSAGFIDRLNRFEGAIRFKKIRMEARLEPVRLISGAFSLNAIRMGGALGLRMNIRSELRLSALRASGSAKLYYALRGTARLSALSVEAEVDLRYTIAGVLVAPKMRADAEAVLRYVIQSEAKMPALYLSGMLFGLSEDRPYSSTPVFIDGTSGSYSLAAGVVFGNSKNYKAG